MDAQRKTLENQVAYASVRFELREEYQAKLDVAPPSTATRLRNAAVEGYKSAVENAIDLAEFLLNAGPTLLLWGLIFFWPAHLLWRRFRRATAQYVWHGKLEFLVVLPADRSTISKTL